MRRGGPSGQNNTYPTSLFATAADWKKFITANAATTKTAAGFEKKFGISFEDSLNVIDDVAAAPDANLTLDTITNDILAGGVGTDWQRARSEQESWADFKTGNGAAGKFKDNTGHNKPPDFAQKDVRIQAKDGRVVTGSSSAAHKFEYRGLPDEDLAKQMLVSGKMTDGTPLLVAQKLYELAQDKQTLPADGDLTLLPKYTVLQKRRRTHLDMDDVSTLQSRQKDWAAQAATFTTASKPVPAALRAYQAKVDEQLKFVTDARLPFAKTWPRRLRRSEINWWARGSSSTGRKSRKTIAAVKSPTRPSGPPTGHRQHARR
jgi:hypothetical protein